MTTEGAIVTGLKAPFWKNVGENDLFYRVSLLSDQRNLQQDPAIIHTIVSVNKIYHG